MDQPPAAAFTAFADVWPRAIEMEKGAALYAIGAGNTMTFFLFKWLTNLMNIDLASSCGMM